MLFRSQTAGLQPGGGAAAGPFGALQQSGRSTAAGLQAGGDRTASLPARSESGRGQDGGQGGVHVTADTVNNSLLITANRENYRTIERTLRELDRPQLQVAIEATIAEVTLNNTLQYGVQTFLSSGDIGLKPDRGSSIFSTGANAILQRALPGFNLLLGPAGSPRLILDALRGYTDVKVVSSPSLVVLDNQAASLQVGDQVPIITRSATGVDLVNSPVVNNVDYRNTGVILRVIPRINANGNVLLDIDQEISNVVPGTSGSLTPTISQRKVKSTISVASGQTVMLGGLISERQNGAREGIPILERISFIGDFFAHNSTGLDRTELIIFIKPKIIRDGQDAQTVAEDMRVKILAGRPHAAPPALVRK